MIELILAFVAGMVVMDLMWAHKLGILRLFWSRIKTRFSRSQEA